MDFIIPGEPQAKQRPRINRRTMSLCADGERRRESVQATDESTKEVFQMTREELEMIPKMAREIEEYDGMEWVAEKHRVWC